MCADNSQLKGFNSKNVDSLVEKAYEWAADIDVSALPKVIQAVIERLTNLYKVSPSTGSDEGENSSKNQ